MNVYFVLKLTFNTNAMKIGEREIRRLRIELLVSILATIVALATLFNISQ